MSAIGKHRSRSTFGICLGTALVLLATAAASLLGEHAPPPSAPDEAPEGSEPDPHAGGEALSRVPAAAESRREAQQERPAARDAGPDAVHLLFVEDGRPDQPVAALPFWLESPAGSFRSHGRSGEDGRATVELPVPESQLRLLTAFLPPQRLDLRGSNREFHVAVPPPLTAQGVVLDPDGQPCPDARVLVVARDELTRHALLATTDARGRFAVDGIRAESGIFAERDDHARSLVVYLGPRHPGRFHQLRLGHAVPYTGRIVAPDGTPVAGATVALGTRAVRFVEDPQNGRRCPSPPIPAAITGADGRFAFPRVRTDFREPVTVTAAGYAITTATGNEFGEPIVVQMQRCRAIEGVVRSPRGEPVPGARIGWGPRWEHVSEQAWTDSDGRFRLRSVPDAPSVRLHVNADGFHALQVDVALAEREAVLAVLRPE